uniref:Uncharacterized protein n=1 Tax=Tetranychus urticae TaxID=32264 RepID=T1L456_TETUR
MIMGTILAMYQSENPLVVVLCVGLLAIVLMYIFSKIAAIYTEASINYAKYKFVKKGLDLKNKIEELKVARKKKPHSVITKESNRFTRLIEDEKWLNISCYFGSLFQTNKTMALK